MFIMKQNIGFDALAKLLSPDVKTSDNGISDGKDFATLLAYLINKNENEDYSFESTGTGVIHGKSQAGEISTSGNVNPFENDSASLVAGEDEVLDAEMILQDKDGKNVSIPVMIFFAGHHRDIEPDTTALVLFIDTNALNYPDKEKLSSLFNQQQIVINTDISDTLEKVSGKSEFSIAVDADVNPEKTHDNEFINIKSYESTHTVDTISVLSENRKVLDKTPLIYANLSQPLQFDSGLIVARIPVQKFVIKATEKDSDVPRFVLHISSDDAPLVVKPLETTSSNTSLLKLLQKYSSSGEHIEIAIVVKSDASIKSGSESIPTGNTSNNNSVSLSSTPVEGTVYDNVMSQEKIADISPMHISNQDILKPLNIKELPVPNIEPGIVHNKVGTENTTVLYSKEELNIRLAESENIFKVDPEKLENLQYVRINNQNAVTSDTYTTENSVVNLDDDTAHIFKSPEMAGNKSKVVHEFNGQIINDSVKNAKSMSYRAEIDTSIESSRDFLPSQFPQEFGKGDKLSNHYITFKDNETGYTGENHDISVSSDGMETMFKDKPIIENSPSSGMIKESSTASPADSKNIFVGVKNIPDNTVERNDNSFHISKETVEGTSAGETITTQTISDKSVLGVEVIHNNEKTVESLKSNPEISTSYRAGSSERNTDLNIPDKDNLRVINVSENNEAKEIAKDLNDNLLRYSAEKQSVVRNTGSTENISAEFDSPTPSSFSLNSGGTSTQSEFQQDPEFLNDGESTQKQLSALEMPSGEDIPEVKMNSGEQYFGLQGTSESTGESIFNAVEAGFSRGRIYSETDKKQILNNIVRQARFMKQKGFSSAVIKLEPPSLGRLQLDIIIVNSRVTGRIIVESSEVKELIQNSISELRENLAQNGLKVDSFDVHVGYNGGTDNWARMEILKKFANKAQNSSAFANNSNVPAEEQTTMSKPVRNKSIYSEVFDVWI